ncbi:unnamed protein product, partial [Bubo scandiacus]
SLWDSRCKVVMDVLEHPRPGGRILPSLEDVQENSVGTRSYTKKNEMLVWKLLVTSGGTALLTNQGRQQPDTLIDEILAVTRALVYFCDSQTELSLFGRNAERSFPGPYILPPPHLSWAAVLSVVGKHRFHDKVVPRCRTMFQAWHGITEAPFFEIVDSLFPRDLHESSPRSLSAPEIWCREERNSEVHSCKQAMKEGRKRESTKEETKRKEEKREEKKKEKQNAT